MLFSVKPEKLPVFFMNMILKKTGNNSVGGHVFCQNPETYKVKMPSPKVIRNAFWLITVRVLKSYEICKWQIE